MKCGWCRKLRDALAWREKNKANGRLAELDKVVKKVEKQAQWEMTPHTFRLLKHDFVGGSPRWDVQVSFNFRPLEFSSMTDDYGYPTIEEAEAGMHRIIDNWGKPKIIDTVIKEVRYCDAGSTGET